MYLQNEPEQYRNFERVHVLEFAYWYLSAYKPKSKYTQAVKREFTEWLSWAIEELEGGYAKWITAHGSSEENDEVYLEDILGLFLQFEWDGTLLDYKNYNIVFNDGIEKIDITDTLLNAANCANLNDLDLYEISVLLDIVDGESEFEDKKYDLQIWASDYLESFLRDYYHDQFIDYSFTEVVEYFQKTNLAWQQKYLIEIINMYENLVKMRKKIQNKYYDDLASSSILMTRALNIAHHRGKMSMYVELTKDEMKKLNYIKVLPERMVQLREKDHIIIDSLLEKHGIEFFA